MATVLKRPHSVWTTVAVWKSHFLYYQLDMQEQPKIFFLLFCASNRFGILPFITDSFSQEWIQQLWKSFRLISCLIFWRKRSSPIGQLVRRRFSSKEWKLELLTSKTWQRLSNLLRCEQFWCIFHAFSKQESDKWIRRTIFPQLCSWSRLSPAFELDLCVFRLCPITSPRLSPSFQYDPQNFLRKLTLTLSTLLELTLTMH